MDSNPDFKDLLHELNAAGVRYLVVGAYAVIFYTEPRFTKDLDIWIEPTPANADRVWRALARFGAPLEGVVQSDFANPELVYQIGIEPNRIDIMMDIGGVNFPQAWQNRVASTYGGEPVPLISLEDLIIAKKHVDRPQDRLDVANLEIKKQGNQGDET